MDKRYRLELLTPAQRELEEIARVHLVVVGPSSARKITDRIYTALGKLQTHPKMGIVCRDQRLASGGYRMLICGVYLCFYRLIANTIFVYHIVDSRVNYPKLISDLKEPGDDNKL